MLRFVENKFTNIHIEPASDSVATPTYYVGGKQRGYAIAAIGGICIACGHSIKARCQCRDYGHDHMAMRFDSSSGRGKVTSMGGLARLLRDMQTGG